MMQDISVEEDTRKRAAKPALKKHPIHSDGKDTPDAGESKRKHKGHLKWDEEVIAEHDQLRGTRMKVSVIKSNQ